MKPRRRKLLAWAAVAIAIVVVLATVEVFVKLRGPKRVPTHPRRSAIAAPVVAPDSSQARDLEIERPPAVTPPEAMEHKDVLFNNDQF